MHSVMLAIVMVGLAQAEPAIVNRYEPVYGGEAGRSWDTLHEMFFVRTFTTGETYHHRFSFDPPWSRYLRFVQQEDVFDAAILRLRDVERMPREDMEQAAPVRKLLFFRDLWAVFEGISKRSGDDGTSASRREAIQRSLARIMRRLELTDAEVAQVPDSLHSARTDGTFPKRFDPTTPKVPFLPTELLEEKSGWVARRIEEESWTSAPIHEESVNRRSLFTVHVRAPDGGQGSERLLSLAHQSRGRVEFPPGTVLALLRRALAATRGGRLVVTNVVESLQLLAKPATSDGGDARFKFVLDRRDFVAGKTGLRLLSEDSPLDVFGFESTGQWTKRAMLDADGEVLALGRAKGPVGIPSLKHCATCHGPSATTLFANFAQTGSLPASDRELRKHIETAKAESNEWAEYLRLRGEP